MPKKTRLDPVVQQILSHVHPTPMVTNDLTEDQKITKIAEHFREIMRTLGPAMRNGSWPTAWEASRRAGAHEPRAVDDDTKQRKDPMTSDAKQTKFAWMTAHKFESTPPVKNPFTDLESLK